MSRLKILKDEKRRNEMIADVRWVFKYSKKYKTLMAVCCILGFVSVCFGLCSGLASKYLIDAVQCINSNALLKAGIVFFSVGIFSMAFSAISSRFSAKASIKITNEVREELCSHILSSRWESIKKFPTGDILNRFSSDISSVVRFILSIIPGVFVKLFQFVCAFGVMFYFDKVFALISLCGAPLLVLSGRLMISKMREFNSMLKETDSEIMSFSEETFSNLVFVKSFSLASLFIKKLAALQQKQKDISLEFNKFSIISTSIISLVGMLVYYVSLSWGIYRLWYGNITYGTMVLFLQLSSKLTSSFSALVSIVPEIISASTSAGRVRVLEELKDEESVPIKENFDMTVPPDIIFDKVTFEYEGAEKVFIDADFTVKSKEIAAVIGKSGSGKTTILRILLGLVKPLKGKALLRNNGKSQEISALTRSAFSYVSQENILFSGTVAENLRMVKPDADEDEIIKVLKIACADFVLDLPDGINTVISHSGKGLSTGQIQRISIARALISDAPVLLLDEATSSLDKETEKQIIKNIFGSDMQKTCILTTHRDSLLDVCDKVFKVSNNKVIEVHN